MKSESLSSDARLWVVDDGVFADTLERLGEARLIADRRSLSVGVLIVTGDIRESSALFAHGADEVVHVRAVEPGPNTLVSIIREQLAPLRPLLVLLPYERFGRSVAALLAAKTGWTLISPALSVQVRRDEIVATALDASGRKARSVVLDAEQPAIATIRASVAEAISPDPSRTGRFRTIDASPRAEAIALEEKIPADPATTDIRHLERLIAGGRGLGDRSGFDLLRRVAGKLHAGVAASRMAVDLGWIEYDRQVGQTGKTVTPDLYIACGISGASHHLDGMSGSTHIIAINTDKQAPILRTAHVGLVADLHEVLAEIDAML